MSQYPPSNNAARLVRRFAPVVAVLGLLNAAIAWPVGAQERSSSRTLEVEDWLDWERVSGPQISPDGSRVLYERRWVDKINDRWESAVWMVGTDGTRNRFLLDGSSPRWSPDGTRIAYLAPDADGRTQIFTRWMDAEGAVSQVTRVTDGTPSDIAWSPDGGRIAFGMRISPQAASSALWQIDLPRPTGSQWTPDPRIVESLVYRQDRRGWVDEGFVHLFVVPADGGTPWQVTEGDYDHGSPMWTSDGTGLLFSGLRIVDAGYRWKEAEIYRVDVDTREAVQLTSRKGPDRSPVPSPDGRYIAYVGHDTTGADYIESALYVMEADGSGPRDLTSSLDRTPRGHFWASDGSGIYFNLPSEGHANLHFVSLSGETRAVTEGAHLLRIADIAPNGWAVGTYEGPQVPEDVVALQLDRPEATRVQLTNVNADVLAGRTLGDVEEIWFDSFDGLPINGWIIKPPDFDPSRRYPMMMVIHGGPHSMYDIGFNFAWQEHAARGYVILYTNPRGSSGYGSDFGNAIQYAYPQDDFHDLMAGVDEVVGRGYVDEDNMFVYGCSGGGVLTAWVVGHTDRFTAAASLCPVIDWVSFVGQVDGNYLRWYDDFEKFPWEDPSEHIRRSPLTYVGNVTTPTLLMTGVLDMRTPISQTEEFYQALKAQNKPTAMIRMNGEWHGTSSLPSNFLRTQLYLRKWFERWGSQRPVS
jgi:dipeptidyl aminopeptidase/acylaminoacyl peptidase